MDSDQYKTLINNTEEVLFKDRNSKFYGYAFPVETEEDIKTHIEELKKQHHSARHWCYAYRLGKKEEEFIYRANDDGEPNNSAGMPIYGQILANELTDVLIVVVRYFGGTKLGVGGLINAYRTAAELALNEGKIVTRTINTELLLSFDYPEMNSVMRILKEEDVTIVENRSETRCEIIISVRLNYIYKIKERFKELHKVQLSENIL